MFSLPNLVHYHLLLNHFPTVGTLVALALFIAALMGKREDLTKASLGIFLIIAILTLPVYMSGKSAEKVVKDQEGVSAVAIEAHQDAAFFAFIMMQLTGAAAWLALWQYRRTAKPGRGVLPAVLVLSLITLGVMTRAADMGGEIRHSEIVSDATTANNEWLKTSTISNLITEKVWAWPALEALHFVGLSLMFGVIVVVDLRILGMIKSVSYTALHRVLPWGVLGFAINLTSGMLFFITQPEQYIENIALQWKVVLIVLGGINVLYFTIFDHAWTLESGQDAPLTGKVMAVVTIAVWLGVIYLGRMMPFIGGSF
jgi:uncharacterized membrane protein